MNKKIIKTAIAVITLAATCLGSIGASAKMQVATTASVQKLAAVCDDGTVKVHGYNLSNYTEVNALSDVAAVTVEEFKENSFFCLLSDGTVKMISKFPDANYPEVADWTDIKAIDGGDQVVFGLKNDGTVVFSGPFSRYYSAVKTWTNVKEISARQDGIAALTNDGKVLSAGIFVTGNPVSTWSNIKKAVFDGYFYWGIDESGNIVSTDKKFKSSNIKGSELLAEGAAYIDCVTGFFESQYFGDIYVITNGGTLLEVTNYRSSSGMYEVYVVAENVAGLSIGTTDYVALLKDGSISSNKLLLDTWFLGIDVRVNGKYVDSDTPPYIKNGRTMVPIRAISEALGATVEYDDATRTAKITRGEKVIEITMNEQTAKVNGAATALDAPAENVNSRIFVPVRFISEGFGLSVKWYDDSKSVIITE